MSAASNWSAANNVACSVAGGVVAFTDCDYGEDSSEFETTNLSSPRNPNGKLCFEGDTDVIKTSFKGTIVTDKLNIKHLYLKKYTDFTWTDDLGETHTGTLVVTKRGKKAATKGAYTLPFEGFFTGLVTGQG